MKRVERAFVVRVAELLHKYGTPAHRLERVLSRMAAALGDTATFLSTPTSVIAAFGPLSEQELYLLRIEPGEVDLGKLVAFDDVMEDVEHGRIDVAAGLARLEAIEAAPPRYGLLVSATAVGFASATAARFFGGGAEEIAFSGVLGSALFLLGRLLRRHPASVGLYEPLAAFLAAATTLVVARAGLAVDDSIVTLSSLIVLLPGLSLTVGMTELATRHLVSGTARMAGAGTNFFTLLLGVGLAWRLGALAFPEAPPVHEVRPLAPWTEWVALSIAPFAFAVLNGARRREFGVIFLTGVAGFLAARSGAHALGSDLGAFLGALVVGLASNLYARWVDRPALVPSTPGILLLVPGSIGYRSLTSFLDRDSQAGMEWAFQTGLVAVALVGGLLLANLILPPRRVL